MRAAFDNPSRLPILMALLAVPAAVWAAPGLLLPGAAALVCLAAVALALRHTAGFCAAWLLVCGATVEMAAMDLLGAE